MRPTIQDVSVEQYQQMNEEEKQVFYKRIVDSSPQHNRKIYPIFETKIRTKKNFTLPQSHQEKGRLAFVNELDRKNVEKDTRVYYLTVCDCGNWYITRNDAYKKETAKAGCLSCGCLNEEFLSKNIYNPQIQEKRIQKLKEYLSDKGIQIGDDIFGWKITQIEIRQMKNHTRKYVKGICPYCHKESDWIRGDGLTSHSVLSCGCTTESKGEQEIRLLLTSLNIPFEQEKTFKTCINPNTNRPLRFDFYVNNSYIIEFDGEQHFKQNGLYGQNVERFLQAQERDKIKNKWCVENNIPIIRIPYTKLENIQECDVKIETSKYLIK